MSKCVNQLFESICWLLFEKQIGHVDENHSSSVANVYLLKSLIKLNGIKLVLEQKWVWVWFQFLHRTMDVKSGSNNVFCLFTDEISEGS